MTKYICPMHPNEISDKPGKCKICHMNLVIESDANNTPHSKSANETYKPLVIIVLLILLVCASISFKNYFQIGIFIWQDFATNFMIGFFLVFSGFKLIDLKGFSEGYSTYDLLAKRFPSYGYIYPFIELFFAISMILRFQMELILFLEFIVMTFSGIGVLIKILKKEKFQCACLGTFLKVPLTKVTLIEDFGMAALALLLIILG